MKAGACAAPCDTEHFAIETRIATWHVDDGLSGERLDADAPTMARWRQAYGDGVTPGFEATRKA